MAYERLALFLQLLLNCSGLVDQASCFFRKFLDASCRLLIQDERTLAIQQRGLDVARDDCIWKTAVPFKIVHDVRNGGFSGRYESLRQLIPASNFWMILA